MTLTMQENPHLDTPLPMSDAERQARVQLAACYRVFDQLGWTETIFNQSARGNTDGPARVPGMIPGDVSYADVELVEGYHSEVDVHDYPIWAEIEPVPVPPPGDVDPCPEMPPEEKRLRDRLRERGIDWVTLIRLILEIVDLIAKGRN